jgi:hypothetical protein
MRTAALVVTRSHSASLPCVCVWGGGGAHTPQRSLLAPFPAHTSLHLWPWRPAMFATAATDAARQPTRTEPNLLPVLVLTGACTCCSCCCWCWCCWRGADKVLPGAYAMHLPEDERMDGEGGGRGREREREGRGVYV